MVDAEFFEKLEYIARALRKDNAPFGGIQLICCGDFFQLPPVGKGREAKYEPNIFYLRFWFVLWYLSQRGFRSDRLPR